MTEQDQNVTPEDDMSMTLTLVRQLRDADPNAGVMLNNLYREKLIRFCWGYLGRLEEAEDAVQDICYAVLRANSVPESFRPWLYKTARNQCLNLLRRRARRRDGQELPPASQIHESLTGHLTKLVQGEEQSRLSQLVRALPETQQEVLRLRYVEDLPRTEIAEVLDIAESVVKSRLYEGLKRLREQASALEEP